MAALLQTLISINMKSPGHYLLLPTRSKLPSTTSHQYTVDNIEWISENWEMVRGVLTGCSSWYQVGSITDTYVADLRMYEVTNEPSNCNKAA